MSKKGNCWDNTVDESFFHSLKTEFTNHEIFETRAKANEVIFEYIEVFYNQERMHSSIILIHQNNSSTNVDLKIMTEIDEMEEPFPF